MAKPGQRGHRHDSSASGTAGEPRTVQGPPRFGTPGQQGEASIAQHRGVGRTVSFGDGEQRRMLPLPSQEILPLEEEVEANTHSW